MSPGRDIAIATSGTGSPQPERHSLATLADDAARTPLIPNVDPGEPEDELPLYAARQKVYPQRVRGTYRRVKWAVLFVTLGIYYLLPFVRWDRGPNAPSQAVLIDFPEPALLFLLHRNLAAGILLPDRPAHHRGDGAVSDERGRRAPVVRLSVSADGVDRPVPGHRALDRRRPARAFASRPTAVDGRTRGARREQSIFSG